VSAESAEKRFDATPSRRERAKREGNVARSHEVAGVASFAGGLLALAVALPLLTAQAAIAVRASAAAAPSAVPAVLLAALGFVPAAGAAAAAVAAGVLQAGGLRVAPLKLAFDKLAPLPGLRRMFGAEAAVGGARALLAFVAAIAVVAPAGVRVLSVARAATSPAIVAGLARDAMLQAAWTAAGTGALFALADYAIVRRRWLHGLKMTLEEFKRDAKEQDGDPQAKSRRKQLHRSFARSGVARTREASFVVVNPTHIAIAVRYAPPRMPVPEILVRAADDAAREVRAIAERAHIPLVEDVPLARLLWRCGEAGRPIPPESFVPVAYAIAALARAGLLDA
jgi:flagellar biosynthesis protein FlhB